MKRNLMIFLFFVMLELSAQNCCNMYINEVKPLSENAPLSFIEIIYPGRFNVDGTYLELYSSKADYNGLIHSFELKDSELREQDNSFNQARFYLIELNSDEIECWESTIALDLVKRDICLILKGKNNEILDAVLWGDVGDVYAEIPQLKGNYQKNENNYLHILNQELSELQSYQAHGFRKCSEIDWNIDKETPGMKNISQQCDEVDLMEDMVSYSAVQFNETCSRVSWRTQTEIDILEFAIYRDETKIFTVAPANSYGYHDYSLIDALLEQGSEYAYRIREIRYDGTLYEYGPILLQMEEPGDEFPEHPPYRTHLVGNFPNPFNPQTIIKYFLEEDEKGLLEIFNSKGECVLNKIMLPGENEFIWDAKDVASGVYFYTFSSQSYSETKKMILLK